MAFNINDTVNYSFGDSEKTGKIVEISSDMDSYEDMELKDGVPLYWSKKMKKFTPVKPKNMDTVFLTVLSGKGCSEHFDYITLDELNV